MKIIIIFIMFFLIGAFFIISENNLALSKTGNVDKVAGIYSSWLSQIFDNALSVTGDVVKMSWFPEKNQTSNDSG